MWRKMFLYADDDTNNKKRVATQYIHGQSIMDRWEGKMIVFNYLVKFK